jgi:hypothetical protein
VHSNLKSQVSPSCGGWNRTSVWAVNSRLPVPTRVPPQCKVRMAGFEPAVSCARRPCYARCPAEYQAFLHPACEPDAHRVAGQCSHAGPRNDLHGTLKSAQRELNPRFLHGKQVGFRYIMGALWYAELSMNKSTERESNPRHRITKAVSSPLDYRCQQSLQWDQRDLNPHLAD